MDEPVEEDEKAELKDEIAALKAHLRDAERRLAEMEKQVGR